MASVCVLGAGVVGLTTALRLRQAMPHLHVTLLAENFGLDTTSHGSGGLWEVIAFVLAGLLIGARSIKLFSFKLARAVSLVSVRCNRLDSKQSRVDSTCISLPEVCRT